MGRVFSVLWLALVGMMPGQPGWGEDGAVGVGVEWMVGAWRGGMGLGGNGVAEEGQRPPVVWSKSKNVLWRAPIAGRGHSSPIVVGDRVIVTAADEEREVQSVVCLDRGTGAVRWQAVVHEEGMERKGHKKSTQASSTAASDGERVFVNFMNYNASKQGWIYTTALDLDGRRVWQAKVSEFVMHQGFGSSPVVWGNLVFVTTDSRGGGVVAALDRGSGKLVWESKRPEKANYASA